MRLMENLFTTEKSGSQLKLACFYSGTMSYDPGEKFGPRQLNNFELVLVTEGHPVYETQHGRCRLEPGSIVFARPGLREIYYGDSNANSRHLYFCFNFEEIPADWPDTAVWPSHQLSPSRVLGELFRQIMDRAAQCPTIPDNRLFESFFEFYFNPPSSRRSSGSTRILRDDFTA